MTRPGPLLIALLILLLAPCVQAEESLEPRSAPATESAPLPSADTHEAAPSRPPEGDLVVLETHPKAELLVNVELDGNDSDARYEIRAFDNDAVLLKCDNRCNFRIWPGRYRLLTRTAKGRVLGDETVHLDRDTRIDVTSPSTFELVFGGITTAAGLTALVTGLVLYRESPCDRACRDDEAARNQVGVGLMLGGAVTLPVGLVLLRSGWASGVSLTAIETAERASDVRRSTLPIGGFRWAVAF